MSPKKPSTNRLLRIRDVQDETGLSRASIYRRIHIGLFPKCVNLGVRAVGWPAAEVEALNAARIAGKSNDEVRLLVRQMHTARASAMKGVE